MYKYELVITHTGDSYGVKPEVVTGDDYRVVCRNSGDSYGVKVEEVQADDWQVVLSLGMYIKGDKGDDGRGIVSIEKTGTRGSVDTYTITYTDGTTSTFEVTNGSGAEAPILTIKVNGVPLVPDADKAVDIPVPEEDTQILNSEIDDMQF